MWQARCLAELSRREKVQLIPLCASPSPSDTDRRRLVWRIFWRLWVCRRSRGLRPASRRLCEPSQPTDGFDIVLDLTNSAPLESLPETRYGVWSFAFGSPPCFWPWLRRAPTVSAALVTVLPSVERRILRQGEFRLLPYSYVRTLDGVLFGCADWVAAACHDLGASVNPAISSTAHASFPGEGLIPTNRQTVGFLLRQAGALGQFIARYVTRAEQWTIGVIQAPASALLDSGAHPPVTWLPELRGGRFLADPFALPTDDGTLTILAEEFSYRTFSGNIASVHLPAHRLPCPPRPALPCGGHAAYPYLFRYQGETYCVPDTGLARELLLYRADAFPHHWTCVATLLSGVAALDATIFAHGDLWWLLYSDGDAGAYGTLYGCYAPTPLGPWVPHGGNPLKVDVYSSRCAGTPFIHRGQLYRPAQDCSRTYGGALTINRVLHLSPNEFREETVSTVRPDPRGLYPAGLHTLCAVGETTLIDGRRDILSFYTLWGQSRQLLSHRRGWR